ncbi:RNA-directed DNA polymerase, eukaryota, reverse transcriptase zinc-binding domain protein [Tanacetum coccineum]
MNTLDKQKEVMNLVFSEQIQVCAVLETRLKSKKLHKVCDKVFQDWEWVSNMEVCNKGCRIVIGWDSETNVQILHKTSQTIFCIINAPEFKVNCYFSFVYAVNKGLDRRELWKVLINDYIYVNGKPWCIDGDMNVILPPNEHYCGSSIMNPDMMEFQDCLNAIEVEDICSSDLHFTWTKNLHKVKMGNMTGVLKKLNRIMSIEDFIKNFPQAHAKFLSYIISDHTHVILCVPSNVRKKFKSFRFSNYITDKQEFIPIVKENGIKTYMDTKCIKCFKIFKLLLRLKEAKLVEEFFEGESDEEKFLHQQAKIKWLCEGEKNNNYFHRVLKGRRNKSKVFALCDDNGISSDQEQIPQLFLKHFEKFLSSNYPVQDIKSSETLVKKKLSFADDDKMIADVSDAKIKRALFDIDDSKSPGPDGFITAFFKQVWRIAGVDICNVVKEFFSSGKMLGELNANLVSLIPNIQTPNKLQPGCFFPGRHIQDNILLTQKIMRGYNRKRVAFKTDIQKAYDTVNWDFLKKVLEGFGYHEKMVNWVMQCVTTAAFTLNVNGDRIGYFKGGIGLRQGDLISLYLFTLIMEVFLLILQREIDNEPLFQHHFGYKSLKLSHVCFADDLLFMCHGDTTSVRVIKKDLDDFSACSGLFPNNSKSIVFLGV